MKGKKLRATLAYPALFEPEPEGGFTVTFPEANIAATYGPSWDAARAQAEDMLEEADTRDDRAWRRCAVARIGAEGRSPTPLNSFARTDCRQARNLPGDARRGSRGRAARATIGLGTRPGDSLVRAARYPARSP